MDARFYYGTFLAHLPYRKRFFRFGGYLRCPCPLEDEAGFLHYLADFYPKSDLSHARQEAARAKQDDAGICLYWDEDYPLLLKHIFDPPGSLFYRGSKPPWNLSFVSIVGTRNPALISLSAVEHLVACIAPAKEIGLISGFARGIDRKAHVCAMDYGMQNLAVLGSGVSHIVPLSNLDLLRMAEKKGSPFTLLSEYPPLEGPRPFSFPRRNRIIAGIASATIIVQAPADSGALITARYCIEENHELWVFDHHLLAGKGFNEGGRRLLEEGANRLEMQEFNRRIVDLSKLPLQEQLEKRVRGGLRWLGGDFYLDGL